MLHVPGKTIHINNTIIYCAISQENSLPKYLSSAYITISRVHYGKYNYDPAPHTEI